MNQKNSYCAQVQEDLSDYLEGTLPSGRSEAIEAHLQSCALCAAEERSFASLLSVLHSLPQREPVLDLWAELSPRVDEVRAEMRMGVFGRMRLRAGRIVSNFAAGTILFTRALAVNTESSMRKYLVNDPFFNGEEA